MIKDKAGNVVDLEYNVIIPVRIQSEEQETPEQICAAIKEGLSGPPKVDNPGGVEGILQRQTGRTETSPPDQKPPEIRDTG